jgi:FAD-binding domain/Ferric reductase NAD binding domain
LLANFTMRIVYRNRVPLNLSEFVQGFPTFLEVLPGGVTRVVVQCPQQFKWKPGQHCFISIPGISVLQAHPFTIVSLSWPISLHGRNELVLLVRACQGFTKMVADLAATSSRKLSTQSIDPFTAIAEAQKLRITTRSWIDGPYGDYHCAFDRHYHGVVCVSGGSGITASLPWIVYLAAKMRSAAHSLPVGEKICKTRSVHLIWSIRSLDWIRWAERELTEALHDVMRANKPLPGLAPPEPSLAFPFNSRGTLKISIYITRRDVDETEMKMAGLDLLLGAGVEVDNPHAQVEVICGRPCYANLLPRMVDKKRNIVLGKPPPSSTPIRTSLTYPSMRSARAKSRPRQRSCRGTKPSPSQ